VGAVRRDRQFALSEAVDSEDISYRETEFLGDLTVFEMFPKPG
jgi:hypothetical protein